MFDFAWSEIAVIAAVALIAIGPKDMPVAIRSVTGMIKKARRMASEFQTHVDEMLREADLADVKNSLNEIRNFDLRSAVDRAVDPDGGLKSAFNLDPEHPTPATPVTSVEEIAVSEPAFAEIPTPEPEPPPDHEVAGDAPEVPAFIPPNVLPPPRPPLPVAAAEPEAPAFIPPAFAQRPSAETRPRP
jgi:sec-independent protein translocase protein TatB